MTVCQIHGLFALRERSAFLAASLGEGETRTFFWLGTAFALGRHRVVQRRVAAHHADIRHMLGQIFPRGEHFFAGIGPVADQNEVPVGKPRTHVEQHFACQGCFAGLALAGQVQPAMDRQAKNDVGLGNANGQSHHHPMIAAGGGDAFGGGSHRVAEPAQAVDVLAAFVQQCVVDDQIEQTGRIEAHDDLHGHTACQVRDGPGRTTEEIVMAVERMSFFPIDGCVGLNGLKDGELGASREAHQPAQKDLAMCLKRRLRKSGQQALQQNVQRGYQCKHKGPPCPSRERLRRSIS